MPDLDLSLDDIRSGGVLSGLGHAPEEAEREAPKPPSLAASAATSPAEPAELPGASVLAAQPPRRRANARTHAGRSRETVPRAVSEERATAHGHEVLERSSRQTSMALDPELLASLDTYRRALGESQNAVLVAILRVGLPTSDEDAVDAMLTEKYEHQVRRVEQNVRLPLPLLDRVDELVAPARAQDRSLSRAHLVNAALRAGMPESVDEARKLMANHLKARISASKAGL